MEGANASLQGLKQNPTDEVMFRSESKLPPSPRLRRGVVEGRKFGSWKLEVGSWELGVGSWELEVASWELPSKAWTIARLPPTHMHRSATRAAGPCTA